MTDPALSMSGLTYRYPNADRDALTDIELELAPGEFCVLAGRSGSGKTTLMRAASGLVPHFHGGEIAGRLEVGGLDVRDNGPGQLATRVAYVAQEPETQVVSTTVHAEIELGLELRGEPPSVRARAVEEVALALAIPYLLDRTTDSLSGGELQRVALAAALAARPRLLLLDEPTSQLDPVAGDELIWLLRRLNEEWGVAVLLSEHRLERCLAAADRVLAMDTGCVAFDGAPGAFLEWALHDDPALATPVARMFDLAGIRQLPAGVRAARQMLDAATDGAGATGTDPGSWEQNATAASRPADRATSIPGRPRRPRADSPPALEVREAWVTLPTVDGDREVLRDVDLRVEPGERIALMGRNGAGKSTLLRAVAGLVDPARGRIETPREVALLPQEPADLFVHERVNEELPGEDGQRALASVGLNELSDADPRDLSGGERQRLALAIVMAGRADEGNSTPGLILLDEPTRGMDRARKKELAGLAGELSGRGAAVIIATHDVEFAATFADRVVLLGDGELIADGPCEELLSGGWYFSTEIARVLEVPGVISPEAGARVISGELDEAVRIGAGERQ